MWLLWQNGGFFWDAASSQWKFHELKSIKENRDSIKDSIRDQNSQLIPMDLTRQKSCGFLSLINGRLCSLNSNRNLVHSLVDENSLVQILPLHSLHSPHSLIVHGSNMSLSFYSHLTQSFVDCYQPNLYSLSSYHDYSQLVRQWTLGKGRGWSRFTVFGLLMNGDIQSLCPVCPEDGKIPPVELLEMYAQALYGYRLNMKAHPPTVDDPCAMSPVAEQYHLQLLFIQELWNSMGMTVDDLPQWILNHDEKNTNSTSSLTLVPAVHPDAYKVFGQPQVFRYKNRMHLKVKARGPYRVQPVPVDLETVEEAVCLTCIDGWAGMDQTQSTVNTLSSSVNAKTKVITAPMSSSQPPPASFPILLCAYASGKVDVLLAGVDGADQVGQLVGGCWETRRGASNRGFVPQQELESMVDDSVGEYGQYEDEDGSIPDPVLYTWETLDLGRHTGEKKSKTESDNQHVGMCFPDLFALDAAAVHGQRRGRDWTVLQCRDGVYRLRCGGWARRLRKILSRPGWNMERKMQAIDTWLKEEERKVEKGEVVYGSCWTVVDELVTCSRYSETGKPSDLAIMGVQIAPKTDTEPETLYVLTNEGRMVKRELEGWDELIMDTDGTEELVSDEIEERGFPELNVVNTNAIESALELPAGSLSSLLRDLPLSDSFPFIRVEDDRRKITVGPIFPEQGQVLAKANGVKEGDELAVYPRCVITEEMLSELSRRATQIRDQVKVLRQMHKSMETRLEMFRSESKRLDQLAGEGEHDSRVARLVDGVEKMAMNLESRIAQFQENDERISKRVALLMQLAMELNQPDLSIQEREWFKELEMMRSIKRKSLQEKVVQLQNQLKSLPLEDMQTPSAPGRTGEHQLKTINQLIDQETQFIGDLRSRVLELEQKILLVE